MKARRWTKREDELLLVRAMALEEAAEFLGRTPAELWCRAGELDVDLEPPRDQEAAIESPSPLPAPEPAPAPLDDPLLAELDVAVDDEIAENTECSQGMPRAKAEMAGRRVALALLRGSEEVALDAVRDAWAAHWGEDGPLPQGLALLDVPLGRVIPDLRTLNRLERDGILTVGQLVEGGRDMIEKEGAWQIGQKTRERLLSQIKELRIRAGLDKPAVAEQPATNGHTAAPVRRGPGRPPKDRPAVADDSPDMRAFCETETVRLLPLIERIAWSLKLPIPIEDLVQEGAKAAFEAIPRFDPNHDGGKLKIETFLTPRIRGGMLDYARKTGYLTKGGQRTGRIEHVESLAAPAPFEGDHGKTLGDTIPDDSADDPLLSAAARDVWHGVLRGFHQHERLLVLEYFVHGRTLKSIGADLEISESQCSQLLGQILSRLRSIDESSGGRIREALTQ